MLRYAQAASVPGTLNANAVFQDGTEQERQAFFEAAIAKNAAGHRERVRLMQNRHAGAGTDGIALPEIPKDKGFMLYQPAGFPLLDEAIAEAKEAFKAYKTPGTSKRERDSLEGVPREDRSYNSAIKRLAMHPAGAADHLQLHGDAAAALPHQHPLFAEQRSRRAVIPVLPAWIPKT